VAVRAGSGAAGAAGAANVSSSSGRIAREGYAEPPRGRQANLG
jgi:hypothetical protein